MNFKKALTTHDTFTENMMATHSLSGNAVLDLFFKLGGSRKLSRQEILQSFYAAFAEDRLKTMQVLFYNRDIRGGQGERRSFRIIFKNLCENYPKIAEKNLEIIPKYGRWDDLLICAFASSCEGKAFTLIYDALKEKNGLCGKWMPRDNKSGKVYAVRFAKLFGLSKKEYRKLLTSCTKVVENNMCEKRWEAIDYNHVPSKASLLYRKAFKKHDPERYEKWLESLQDKNSGNKIHADAIFPHDIVRPYFQWGASKDKTIEAQWQALPNYMEENSGILPVCDVSGSMMGLPLKVCVSLGIYISERNIGKFKDCFITFSMKPELQLLKSKDLYGKVQSLKDADWECNTNLEAVFKLILNQAKRFSLPEKEMPKTLLILSDMQFDQCVENADETAMEMIDRMYRNAGYKRPNVVFWNLRTSKGVPVKYDERGTALVSGFSPSILKSILSTGLRPDIVLNKTLEKYDDVKI